MNEEEPVFAFLLALIMAVNSTITAWAADALNFFAGGLRIWKVTKLMKTD